MFLSKLFKRAKNKVMVAIAGLTMVLGAGAALSVAAVSSNLIETNAASANIYFKDAAWWTTDMKTTYVYFWKSTDESVNNGWPGKAMTAPETVSGSGSNVYSASYDTSAGYDRVIFSRANDSGVDAQTNDLTIPTDGKDQYSIVGTSAAWIGQGNKVSGGSWGTHGKVNWYLCGSGSFSGTAWAIDSSLQFSENASNPSDAGMLIHQQLAVGDVFKITNSGKSSWKKRSDVDSTGLNKPAFSTAVTNNALFTVTGNWSSGHSAARDGVYSSTSTETYSYAESNTENMTIYVKTTSSDYASGTSSLGIKTWYSGDHWYPGTRVEGVIGKTSAVYQITAPIQQMNNGFAIYRFYDNDANHANECYIGSFDGGFADPSFYVRVANFYDFYLTSTGKVYIKNSEDASLGYLYFSVGSSYSPASYDAYLYAWDGEGNNLFGAFPGLKYTYLYGHATSNLNFNSKGNLFCVPLSCFKGATKYIISVYKISDNSQVAKSNDLAMFSTYTNNCYHYVGASTGNAPSAADGPAAKAAYSIANAIKGASNQSVCNISTSDATTLCGLYDASSSNSKLTGATVTTWNSIKPTYSDSQNATMPNIRIQLGKIAGGGYVISLGHLPGPSDADSPLTLTLWIVLGAGVLGLGAIGTAYFVSKKKKRHQA